VKNPSGSKSKEGAKQTGQTGQQNWDNAVASPWNAVTACHLFNRPPGRLLGDPRFFSIEFDGMARAALFQQQHYQPLAILVHMCSNPKQDRLIEIDGLTRQYTYNGGESEVKFSVATHAELQ
jgi:hypothetical protein